jgi:hypothetical protein
MASIDIILFAYREPTKNEQYKKLTEKNIFDKSIAYFFLIMQVFVVKFSYVILTHIFVEHTWTVELQMLMFLFKDTISSTSLKKYLGSWV